MAIKKLFRIARDQGRQIGFDLLTVNRGGMYFVHPNHMTVEDATFRADRVTCEIVASQIVDCFVIDAIGNKVQGKKRS